MDQLTSLAGTADGALLIDCRSLAVDTVPIHPSLGILVVHSGRVRELADTAYGDRRAACERAAARLGLASLRDATWEDVADDPIARHVVSENGRVLETARAIAEGDVDRLRELFAASHASLRDDFAVSTPELDALVAALDRAGADGARLTGAGFGGCVVAIVGSDDGPTIASRATADYRRETGLEAVAYVVRAADGAGPVRY
jgi:galactokinase